MLPCFPPLWRILAGYAMRENICPGNRLVSDTDWVVWITGIVWADWVDRIMSETCANGNNYLICRLRFCHEQSEARKLPRQLLGWTQTSKQAIVRTASSVRFLSLLEICLLWDHNNVKRMTYGALFPRDLSVFALSSCRIDMAIQWSRNARRSGRESHL